MAQSWNFLGLFLAVALSSCAALDLNLLDVSCEDLPVSSTLSLDCDGSSQCAFGSTVLVSGVATYNGLDGTDVVNSDNYVAYISASIYGANGNLEYLDAVDGHEVKLCDEDDLTAQDEDVVCPADGQYEFSSLFTLPSLTDNSFANWLASGWDGEAVVTMTDTADEVIGRCTLTFETLVSANSANKYFNQAVPSGKTGLVILLGALAVVSILCCYCCCSRRTAASKSAAAKAHPETEFTRMEDKPKQEEKKSPTGGPAWSSV